MDYKYLLIVFLLITVSFLSCLSVEDAYLAVKSSYKAIENFQADLVQKNSFKAEDTEIESKAKFYYQPDKILIKYTEPQEQMILMSGIDVKFYDKDSNTCVQMRDNDNSIQLNPIYVIDKFWKYSDKKLKENKTAYILHLRPLQEEEFRSIVVEINKKSYFITRITYEDPQENSVEISFTNIDTNTEIPNEIWKLNLPSDVNYIKR
jgi:outer membrane lipoprotein-sorting protein